MNNIKNQLAFDDKLSSQPLKKSKQCYFNSVPEELLLKIVISLIGAMLGH